MNVISYHIILGCTDYFNAGDRRHWVRTLAETSEDPRLLTASLRPSWGVHNNTTTGAAVASAGSSGLWRDRIDSTQSLDFNMTEKTAERSYNNKELAAMAKQKKDEQDYINSAVLPSETQHPSTDVLAWGLERGGADGTWREALLQLKTAYPAGLHTYGLRTQEKGLLERVSDMRSHLQRVAELSELRAHSALASRVLNSDTNLTLSSDANAAIPSSKGNGLEMVIGVGRIRSPDLLSAPLLTSSGNTPSLPFDMSGKTIGGSGHMGSGIPFNIYSQALPIQVNDVDVRDGRERRELGAYPDVSHLNRHTSTAMKSQSQINSSGRVHAADSELQLGNNSSVLGGVDQSESQTQGGSFFANIEMENNQFSFPDDLSIMGSEDDPNEDEGNNNI